MTVLNGKILPLEELARRTASLRSQGRRVVMAHGVFDLLHIGHIRYLQQARRYGDILVVTVTPDQFVGKGPHRPAFTETLRAEALAALEIVDHVAITEQPMAVETIQLLSPDFYVKGAEYQDAAADVTGGIGREEAAVRAVGGQLVFTDDITFSSTSLINRHLDRLPPEVSDYLAQFSGRHSIESVLGYLERASALRVLVVGDAIIDEYQYCESMGKAAKEPMLAVRRLNTDRFAGGILAVGNNVANFAGEVEMLTMLGDHQSEEEFVRAHLGAGVRPTLLTRSGAPTIVKRRLIEGYSLTKLLEVYEMDDGPLEAADDESVCAALEAMVPEFDAVVVVDFGHGMLSRAAIEVLCNRARFLAVNAQSNAGNLGYHTISTYPRADYVSVAEHEIRLEARDRRGDLRGLILDVSARLGCDRMVVTRGRNGALCYGREEGFCEVPAVAGKVVDRVGAGDAFISLTSLCVVQGAPMEVVGLIGNAAGAQAVATMGHARSVERPLLFKHLRSLLKT